MVPPSDSELPDGQDPDLDAVELEPVDVEEGRVQSPLNPQHFRTFLAVVDAGGRLSAAARELGMSQPGVTHQLNELEKRVAIHLLDRARGRPARLTRAGRVFEGYARSIVGQQSALYAEREHLANNIGGRMRVGATPGPGEQWLPPLLCAFGDLHPDVSIELHIADARSIVEQVFNLELELGFVGGEWSRPGLSFEPVWSDAMVVVAAPGHELARRAALTREDFAAATFIIPEPGTGFRGAVEQALDAYGLPIASLHVAAELGNETSVASAVAGGWGIGCVRRESVRAQLDLGTLRVLEVPDFESRTDYLVVRRASRRLSRRAQALVRFLQQQRDSAPEPSL
ncbi:MAG: transcriptional regulator [Thermoleophilia bacterium]|nr:transcriptional regulator [Thermoleophilia bacterium]